MRPRVGLPLCLDDRGRWRADREYHYVDAAYARALDAAGAVPVYLPEGSRPDEALEGVDGLLLPGGDDLLPPPPAEPPAGLDPAPARQVSFDRGLLSRALESGLPVLGICYGLQLLALERGGTLVYELGGHKLDESDGRHAVQVETGSTLAAILEGERFDVNSLHRQAVDAPGQAMQVCARAEDGVVEAIETTGEGFCVGVQWHPEKLDAGSSRRLFDAFVRACRERRA
jgi:putative glutamine amidotransferase